MADAPPLITWGTFGIAVLGVVQPYAYAGWRRWFRARDITVYHSLVPDISFTGVGTSCGLSGTIATHNAASLITGIQLLVHHVDSESNCVLDAYFNRKRSVSNEGGGTDLVKGEIWVPFKAEADAAYPYDILFVEPATKARLDQTGAALRAAWQAFAMPTITHEVASGRLNASQQPARILQLYAEFKQRPIFGETAERIRRDIFWRTGEYRLTMAVRCAEDRYSFRQEWALTLTADEVSAIDGNVEKLQAYACEIPPAVVGMLSFAYPALLRGPASKIQSGNA
jgi:hypothetical protein